LAVRVSNVCRIGVLAGLSGGVAEIAWVAGYSGLTGASGTAVARGVTTAFFPGLADQPLATGLGIAIHMALAVGLGVAVAAAFSAPMLRRIGNWPRSTLVVLTLGVVWAFNFLVVLPVLEPNFLTLLPLAVALTSKLLFGCGAAALLRFAERR
jgi:predicted neutral ceramidase superfamily lipid hydrolase